MPFTDIHVAFNYGQATGSAQLLRFVTEHTEVLMNSVDLKSPLTASRSFITPHSKTGNAVLQPVVRRLWTWLIVCS